VRYLRQWTAYWEDFALNPRRQWQAAYLAGPKRTDLGSYYPLFEGVRAGNFLTALTLCAAAAPEIVKQNISGPQLAIFWAGIVEQPLNDIVAKRFNAASGNQGIQANSDLIKGVVAAADLRAAPDWRDSVRAQILPHLRGRTLLRDGSDTEQSFNYHLAMACLWAQMAKCLDQDPAARDFAQEVYAAAVARYRFLAALQRPSGVKVQELIPGLCKLGDGKVVTNLICPSRAVTDPLVTQIDDHIYRGGPAPAFTSIYFPYGGFAVQRTGWQNDAAHLFFKNSRLSGGHFDLDWLSVQVTAFGRTFLIDSGPGSYGNGDTVKDDYLFSNYAHNTIIVDGLSQNPHPWQEGYLTPIPARWHSSTHFDLAEGVWSGGYGGYQPCARNPPLVADVLHKRQVLLLRDLGIWIITDLLTTSGKSQHQYTQLWNLAPAYSPEQVQINQTAQQIYTTVADEPNIALCHFGAQSVQYQTYYGQLKPSVRGWYRNGNYQPKVDIEAVWSGTGDQVLVTLIIPVSGLQPRVQYTRVIPQTNGTGFSCILTGGTEIVYMAAPIAQVMRIETLAATAQTLLVVSEPGGALYGIALGCHQIKWMGQDNWTRLKRWFWPVPDTRLPTDSEFALQAGQLISTAEIKAPADFHWRETPAGLVPDYSSATNPVSVK
jgi:hypothetical protein